MNNEKTLGEYLKKLRKTYGYSQEYVASHLNITRQTYSHYETGRITPPVNSLYNLAKLYGISVENLLELVVTYNINMDFAIKPQPPIQEDSENLIFMEYINSPNNCQKFKHLNRRERKLLYYFQKMNRRDQDNTLSFMEIMINNPEK